jgi:DNA-binding MurR/RpiR family transcriptional regulator
LFPHLTPWRKRLWSQSRLKPISEQTSLKEIALENNVSEAMVVKLAKKLNFSGFRDF